MLDVRLRLAVMPAVVDDNDTIAALMDHHGVMMNYYVAVIVNYGIVIDHNSAIHIAAVIDNVVIVTDVCVGCGRNVNIGNCPYDCRLHVSRRHIGRRDVGRHNIGGCDRWLCRCNRGQGDLIEQRLAMAEAVEVQAGQASPMAFEDQELLDIVVAPELAAFDLIAVGVNNAKLLPILQHGRVVDLHFDVQVLLRPCFRRRCRSGTGLIKPRDIRVMPGRSDLIARARIGLGGGQAAQHRCRKE